MNRKTLPFILTATTFVFGLFILWYLVTLPVTIKKKAETSNIVVSTDLLRAYVNQLSTTNPPRNYENIDHLNRVAAYIYEQFQTYCPETSEQKYITDAVEYKNLICRFPGVSAEKIIVGAHYDVAGEKPGADDNASGVAGLLELVRLVDKQNASLPYTLEFVAYTLEEPPFFRTVAMGSAVHAKYQRDNKDKVKLMMSLEMIGYYSDEQNSQQYPLPLIDLFYPKEGNFIAVIGKIDQFRSVKELKRKMIEGSAIDVRSFTAPNVIPGMDFSDHLNYWRYGYNAVIITDTAFYRNHNYHKEGDTADKLDYNKMAEVVKGVYWAITNIN